MGPGLFKEGSTRNPSARPAAGGVRGGAGGGGGGGFVRQIGPGRHVPAASHAAGLPRSRGGCVGGCSRLMCPGERVGGMGKRVRAVTGEGWTGTRPFRRGGGWSRRGGEGCPHRIRDMVDRSMRVEWRDRGLRGGEGGE